jgi:hypothetical protein
MFNALLGGRRAAHAGAVSLFAVLVSVGVVGVGIAVASADVGDGTAAVPEVDIIADVVIGVPDGPTADDDASAIVARLGRSPAVVWAGSDQIEGESISVLVAFAPDSAPAARRAVDEAIATRIERETDPGESAASESIDAAELVAASAYTISGRDVTDRALLAPIGAGVALVTIIAAAATTALVSWRVGVLQGLLSGVTMGLAAWLGGAVGSSVVGPFDGSFATTALPAVFAGIVVCGYLLVRVLLWFDQPEGDDQADTIRRAVSAVAIELLLVLAMLAVAAVFLELISPSRSVATGFLAGAVTGALLTLAVVPPVLAVIGTPADPWWEPLPIPNGRDVPVIVLIGFTVFLAALGLFSFRTTSDAEVLDERALGADSAAVAGTRTLLARGGDPTAAIMATFPDGVDQAAKTSWLEGVSQLEFAERVDTPTGRYIQGDFSAAEGLAGPAGAADADEAPGYALIVPGVPSRSRGSIELVDAIESLDSPFDADLRGVPVDARDAAARDRSEVWITILTLAALGGAAVFALVNDVRLALIAGGVRLVGLAGVAGLYHLLVGDVSGTEIQLALLVVTVGISLFELGYLRRVSEGRGVADIDRLLDGALEVEGTAATVALGLAAIASLGLLVPDLAILRRFGILLALVILIKTVIGMWLLRPALLGTRVVSHLASRPVRLALESLAGSRVSSQAEHRAWVDVINGLLETEFELQADPATAQISSVFVADTPVFQKSIEHHQNLAEAGLRVVGRHPQLRALRVVDNSAPPTLVVTVDHPSRQLIDDNGKIVGVRKAERRSVMLWMVMQHDGSYRIADAVELGVLSLASADEPAFSPSAITVAAD